MEHFTLSLEKVPIYFSVGESCNAVLKLQKCLTTKSHLTSHQQGGEHIHCWMNLPFKESKGNNIGREMRDDMQP